MQQHANPANSEIPRIGGAHDRWMEIGYAVATMVAMLLAGTAYALA